MLAEIRSVVDAKAAIVQGYAVDDAEPQRSPLNEQRGPKDADEVLLGQYQRATPHP